MHIYTSSFFKFRNKANFYSFLGASAGTGAPRNTQKIGTQCGCEYGYKNYESFGSLIFLLISDLKRNLLVIGSTGTETPFLAESELPECARLSNRQMEGKSASELEDQQLAEALAKR